MREMLIAGLCLLALGCGSRSGALDDARVSEAALGVELVDADVVFCFCRHGCGPGLDGAISLSVSSSAERAIEVDLRSVLLIGPTALRLDRDGSGLLYNQPPFVIEPKGSEAVFLRLQPDVNADFEPGTYTLGFDWLLDGRTLRTIAAPIAIAHRPDNDC